jgi:hypothetical protein
MRALANVSSSVLKSEKTLREATKIVVSFAQIRATVSGGGFEQELAARQQA